MTKKQKISPNKLTIIFGSIVTLWLVLLTVFAVFSWDMHILQAKSDADTLFRLSVENAEQQQTLDELNSKQ